MKRSKWFLAPSVDAVAFGCTVSSILFGVFFVINVYVFGSKMSAILSNCFSFFGNFKAFFAHSYQVKLISV